MAARSDYKGSRALLLDSAHWACAAIGPALADTSGELTMASTSAPVNNLVLVVAVYRRIGLAGCP